MQLFSGKEVQKNRQLNLTHDTGCNLSQGENNLKITSLEQFKNIKQTLDYIIALFQFTFPDFAHYVTAI